ncbi:UDP-glucuronate 4-epimerase 1-like [Selaginella moellendorffii]|uniref:UDP-glucuronate 4-epimerase 1-like n=1 Tax=Selaginella moellendorffii TaxID=88036 RepID=UPI000D1CB1A6|nr:UDP-glucuronate 4-epimerase 1-like [Selaginella moellendorffii]|eukprot:XP_024517180.1 UDP-glucuronate 4-epimerase 1-like [Selaginella moellendorffii]
MWKMLKKKKELRVLIVGASGFLGSQLALGLAAHNHRNLRFVVTGLDLVRSKRTLLLENKGIEVIIGSATDPKLAMSVMRSKKPNIVVDFTQREHSWSLEDNERTIKSLIDAACSVPSTQGFFFASPNRFYIPSSRSGEKLVESLAPELPFPIVEWRFSTVYGRYGRPDFPYYTFVDQIVHGALVPLSRGRQNYIYIDDAVTLMINSILSTHSIGMVNLFDIGTPWRPISFRRVIKAIARLTNKEANVEEVANFNRPPWEVPYEPPTKLLLLESYTPFETGMSSFIEWFQKNEG